MHRTKQHLLFDHLFGVAERSLIPKDCLVAVSLKSEPSVFLQAAAAAVAFLPLPAPAKQTSTHRDFAAPSPKHLGTGSIVVFGVGACLRPIATTDRGYFQVTQGQQVCPIVRDTPSSSQDRRKIFRRHSRHRSR